MPRSMLKGIITVVGSRFGALSISIVTTPILVRLLGSSGYGTYAFVISILSMLSFMTYVGVATGARKFISEERDIQDWQSAIFGFYFRIGVMNVVFVGSLIILLTFSGIKNDLVGRYGVYRYILIGLLASEFLWTLTRDSLRGLHLEQFSDPLMVIERTLFATIGIGLIYIGLGVKGALIGNILSFIGVSVIGLLILRRHVDLHQILGKWTQKEPSRRKLIFYNLNSVILLLLLSSLYNVDIIFIDVYLSSKKTGLYKAALMTGEFLRFAPLAIQIVMLHSTSSLWRADSRDRINTLSSNITRYTILFTLLLVTGIVTLHEEFLTLYFGPDFDESVTPLLLLLPGAFGFAVVRPIIGIGQGSANFRPIIVSTLAAAVLNIVLNGILIPRFGINGAAIATSISYSLMLFLQIFAAVKMGFNPTVELRVKQSALTFLSTFGVIQIPSLLIPYGIVKMLLIPPLGVVLYISFAVLFGAITLEEIQHMIKLLRRIYD